MHAIRQRTAAFRPSQTAEGHHQLPNGEHHHFLCAGGHQVNPRDALHLLPDPPRVLPPRTTDLPRGERHDRAMIRCMFIF
jgi:hypothetical protein